MSMRSESPEFSEDYERVSAIRRRRPNQGCEEDDRLDGIRQAGIKAAWRAYPRRAVNPYRAGTLEHAAWQAGADGSYEWAAIHVKEDWFRVVDGREVRP